MALQSEMAATLQHHHTNGVLVSSAASPTPSIDSLTGMVVASNGTNAGLNGGDSGHEHSESGLASAGSGGLNTGANTDRVSSSSASSSGLGSSPLGNGSLFSSNATKCAICSGTFQRPKVWMNLLKFMYSEKATKFDEIVTVDLTLCSKCQIDGEDNFCGLRRKYEL